MTMTPEPRPPGLPLEHAPGNGHEDAGTLEADLRGMVDKSGRTLRLIVVSQGVVICLMVLALIVLAIAFFRQEKRLGDDETRIAAVATTNRTAECDSHFTIATAPLPPSATKLGVAFVEASRKAFRVLHCPGTLPPPPESLIKLGKKYAITIRY